MRQVPPYLQLGLCSLLQEQACIDACTSQAKPFVPCFAFRPCMQAVMLSLALTSMCPLVAWS